MSNRYIVTIGGKPVSDHTTREAAKQAATREVLTRANGERLVRVHDTSQNVELRPTVRRRFVGDLVDWTAPLRTSA